jgi:FHA domain-containing protein
MNLVIRALTLNDRPLSEPLLGSFDARGGTIGRSDANTLALPDPERHISRLQAEVSGAPDGYDIRNAGGANPIFVNGRSLAPGERCRLSHRDELQIGGYLLRVLLEDEQAPRTVSRAHVAVDSRAAASPPPAPNGGANPFADLVSPGAAAVASDPFAFLQPDAPPPEARAGTAAPAKLPDDFDPFAELVPEQPAAPAAGGPACDDLLASIGAGAGRPVRIDEAFELPGAPGGSASSALDAFLAGPPAGAANDRGPSTDPLAMFAAATPASAGVAAFDHTPQLQAAYTPPRIAGDPPAAPAAPAARRAPLPGDGDAAALWSAFCDGAGIRAGGLPGLDPPQMRMLGQLMREAVDGTLRLMSVRATAKQELHAAVTTIRARNNNPLKFSPDAQLAMEQLLQPPLRGFMSAPAAMQDAMHDLVGHGIGTMAGMRAALAGVLQRFEPQQLEAQLTERSMLDGVLPMNRKAKLWDLYLQHFEAIRGEAQDDFDTLFGKAFVAAYEEQLDRLPRRDEGA